MPLPSKPLYKDLNITFAKHPVTGALSSITNENAVKRALRNLILTNFYERPYNPEFGGNIRQHLFENFSPFTALQIKKNIIAAISNFEPRVELLEVITKQMDDQNQLQVDIVFRVVNQADPINITLITERLR